MATKVLMPQLGESVTEGTISRWLVSPGDTVKKYDPLCEVSTDKVNAEVPSSVSGTITEIVVPEGETVAVGALICYIEAENGQTGMEQPDGAAPARQSSPDKSEESAETQRPAARDKAKSVDRSGKARYSPAVLALAEKHNIDLNQVEGTGRGGRITRKDVLRFVEQGDGAAPRQTATTTAPTALRERTQPVSVEQGTEVGETQQIGEITVNPGDKVIPVSSVRRTIASRMVQSKHEAPHAWTMVEADVTRLVQYRNKIKDDFERNEGLKLTFLPFFIKAVVESLKEYPILNSVWAEDQIVIRKDINISIAVATEEALYVPVIKNADRLSILGIARAIDDLARKTRENRLTLDDMQGGTFTVNNTGSFGSIQSMPIINHPQAAIMSVEAITRKPVVIDDMIAIRDRVNLCLSLDHRILDGLVCGRFLQSVKQKVENMDANMTIY
ncbi:MAG: 2-oxo acid dehydrogenase subunit E2 [Bacillaceae bacterium]|nr:2-oxo acid dehydrogenase subunit E2 [Bacillaceae bacterium]